MKVTRAQMVKWHANEKYEILSVSYRAFIAVYSFALLDDLSTPTKFAFMQSFKFFFFKRSFEKDVEL